MKVGVFGMVPVVYISAWFANRATCQISNLEAFLLADWEIGNIVYISMKF